MKIHITSGMFKSSLIYITASGVFLPVLLMLFTLLLMTGVAAARDATPDEPPLASIDSPPTWVYPQRREIKGYMLLIHAPQIRSWPQFERFEAWAAVELTPPDGSASLLGTVRFTGITEIDRAARIVTVKAPKITEVRFTKDTPEADVQVVKDMATRQAIDIPLDLFLAYLADDVLSRPAPTGFNTAPPRIHVASVPTLLLFVNGQPVLTEMENTGLKAVANANWPTFKDPAGKGTFYLLSRDLWLSSPKLDSGWGEAETLPAGFEKLKADGPHAALRHAVPLKKSALPVPKVFFTDRPAEVVVTDGEPMLEAIEGTDGLQSVTNTASPLFKIRETWYFLISGRWFKTTQLGKGPWNYSPELPPAFGKIPNDHPKAVVKASVPGTVEARMAALEALLPIRVEAPRDGAPPVEITYAGAPKFETVTGTEVARAVNSGYDVIQYKDRYYLCYAGIWYQASSPMGPWIVADVVPPAIYAIPPSSPAYQVTQVTVADSTEKTIVYTYPPAYSSSLYVVNGFPYCGTGWYYPPYVYGGVYYPYWGSYGYGSWYNPATGGYGSRSVWYGPYGGYSCTEGYNPVTGGYAFAETAWDTNEWGSYGQTYNPRTGISTETGRYYNADQNRSEMSRTVQRGDKSIQTGRNTDFNSRTTQVSRETSGGGSSSAVRSWESGTVTGSGTITAPDGRTATISGEQTRTGGSSTITGSEGSVDMVTKRRGGSSVTAIEGSDGGQSVSVSGRGPGHTTVVQSGSGDLYAGHNGNVYKKTENGWQHYEDGAWKQVDTRAPMPGSERSPDYSQQRAASQSNIQHRDISERQASEGRDISHLDREYTSRQHGTQQFRKRFGGFLFRARGGGRR